MTISQVSVGEKVTASKQNEIITQVNLQGTTRIIPTAATNGSVSAAGVVTSTAQTLVRVRTAFPSTFTVFRIIFDVTMSAATAPLIRLAVDGTDASTNYDYEQLRAFSTTVDAAQSLAQTSGALSPLGVAAMRHFGELLITDPNAAARTLYTASTVATVDPMTTGSGKLAVAGQHRTATAYNSINFFGASGNITVNRLTVEGIS